MRIFLSFSSADAADARILRDVIDDAMKAHGRPAEIFAFTSSNVSADIWSERIRNALRLADAMVVLWTQRSAHATGQMIEIGAAWLRGIDIHVVLSGTSAQSLPNPYLAERHAVGWYDFRAAFEKYLADKRNTSTEVSDGTY